MTARGLPWTDFELQCLYDTVNDLDWFEQVSHLLECRSEGAVRTKMSLLRSEAQIVPQRRGPRARAPSAVERQRAESASHAFLCAIAAAQRQVPPPVRHGGEVQLSLFIGPLFDPPARPAARVLELAA